ncbi:MAG: hypothetical protein A2284_13445 [Deltaproteobacteria bacterium RIFOXYA12_FULL_61_11]|nr:MAG: hypothetical protein A2284_13445 [Deltaproteobacteria bacterium RIFOXYA12_FULL_61_11]
MDTHRTLLRPFRRMTWGWMLLWLGMLSCSDDRATSQDAMIQSGEASADTGSTPVLDRPDTTSVPAGTLSPDATPLEPAGNLSRPDPSEPQRPAPDEPAPAQTEDPQPTTVPPSITSKPVSLEGLPRKAATDLAAYATDYERFREAYGDLEAVQVFGGDLVVAEYPEDGLPYAAHLGGFWAAPYYSGSTPYLADSTTSGFNVVGRFRHGTPTRIFDEQAKLVGQTTATWRPSNMMVTDRYALDHGATLTITGTKVALPRERGFALHLRISQEGGSAGDLELLLRVSLPYLAGTTHWNWYNATVPGTTPLMRAEPCASGDCYLLELDNPEDAQADAILLLGLAFPSSDDGATMTFRAEAGDETPILQDFEDGTLEDHNGAATWAHNSLSLGLATRFADLEPTTPRELTLIGLVGSDRAELLQKWSHYRDTNPIATSEAYWTERLAGLYAHGLPTFTSSDAVLQGIYRNAALHYLMNRWEAIGTLGQASQRGHSLAFFVWSTGMELALALADPLFQRRFLGELLATLGDCRAYSGPQLQPYCHRDKFRTDWGGDGDTSLPIPYAAQRYSLIRLVREYMAATGDQLLLAQPADADPANPELRRTVLAKLEAEANWADLKNRPEDLAAGAAMLTDFGDDTELYEFNHIPECREHFVRYYNAIVPDLNGRRYEAHTTLAEFYTSLGLEPPRDHRTLATANASALRSAWSYGELWYRATSRYDRTWNDPFWPGEVEDTTAARFFQPVFGLLEPDGLLNESERTGLSSHFEDFISDDGSLLSVARQDQPPLDGGVHPCIKRPDWHGSGLYGAAVGQQLTAMLRHGSGPRAIQLLTESYAQLAVTPLWGQSFVAADYSPHLFESHRAIYLESLALAETFLRGLLGLYPSLDLPRLSPRMHLAGLTGSHAFNDARLGDAQLDLAFTADTAVPYTVTLEPPPETFGHGRTVSFTWQGDAAAFFRVAAAEFASNLRVTLDGAALPVSVQGGFLTFTLAETATGIVAISPIEPPDNRVLIPLVLKSPAAESPGPSEAFVSGVSCTNSGTVAQSLMVELYPAAIGEDPEGESLGSFVSAVLAPKATQLWFTGTESDPIGSRMAASGYSAAALVLTPSAGQPITCSYNTQTPIGAATVRTASASAFPEDGAAPDFFATQVVNLTGGTALFGSYLVVQNATDQPNAISITFRDPPGQDPRFWTVEHDLPPWSAVILELASIVDGDFNGSAVIEGDLPLVASVFLYNNSVETPAFFAFQGVPRGDDELILPRFIKHEAYQSGLACQNLGTVPTEVRAEILLRPTAGGNLVSTVKTQSLAPGQSFLFHATAIAGQEGTTGFARVTSSNGEVACTVNEDSRTPGQGGGATYNAPGLPSTSTQLLIVQAVSLDQGGHATWNSRYQYVNLGASPTSCRHTYVDTTCGDGNICGILGSTLSEVPRGDFALVEVRTDLTQSPLANLRINAASFNGSVLIECDQPIAGVGLLYDQSRPDGDTLTANAGLNQE